LITGLAFNYSVELALQQNDKIVISGDLNCDLLRPNNNKLIDLMNMYNLRNVINKPTRRHNNCSSLLDPIIISDTMTLLYSDVIDLPSYISDHDAALAIFECPKAISGSFTREILLYDKLDAEKFNQSLNDIN